MSTSAAARVDGNVAFPVIEDRLAIATRAWLIWLQGLFASRPAGNCRWSPNFDLTEIVITDQEPIGAPVTGARPMIVTSRSQARFSSLSTSQQLKPAFGAFASQGQMVSDLIDCGVTISVIAKEGAEAQHLAYTIFRLIPLFRSDIARLGGMHAIRNQIAIGEEAPYQALVATGSAPGWKQGPLFVSFQIQDTLQSDDGKVSALLRNVTQAMLDIDGGAFGE